MRIPAHRPPPAALFLGLALASIAAPAPALTVAGFGDSMTWAPGYLAQLPADWDVVNLSRGGEVSWDGVARLEALLPTLEADVVVVMEGTNDVRMLTYSEERSVASLVAMLDAILAAGMRPVLMAPPPLLPFEARNPGAANQRLAALRDVLARAAAVRGVAFVDLFERMSGLQDLGSYYLDQVHINAAGSGLVASELVPAIARVPEPSAALLLGAGLALLAGHARARRPSGPRTRSRSEA